MIDRSKLKCEAKTVIYVAASFRLRNLGYKNFHLLIRSWKTQAKACGYYNIENVIQ